MSEAFPGELPDATISLVRLLPDTFQRTRWKRLAVSLVDRILGLSTINRLYAACRASPGTAFEFLDKAIKGLHLNIEVEGGPIPATGSLLVVANHPQGGAEALVLLHRILASRTDVKILSNGVLTLFAELEPLLIRINPLRHETGNLSALRDCSRHLETGGALVIFPAGRVSSWQASERRVTDAPWSELVGRLVLRTEASLLPVFSTGRSSTMFRVVGRLLDRVKLVLLPRELLSSYRRPSVLRIGTVVSARQISHLEPDGITRLARLLVYILSAGLAGEAHAERVVPIRSGLAPQSPAWLMRRELDELPSSQVLVRFQNYRVFHARRSQCKLTVRQITIERERTFRRLAEGSGQSLDTDAFDDTYVHLFVYDDSRDAIVGAYRIGHADELVRTGGLDALYLSRMFEFDPAFFTSTPKLELGRSFVVPEYQKRFHSLLLLWQGIAAYLERHPRYRHLYGTVSLSRLYDPRSVRMACDLLVKETSGVRPRHPLKVPLPDEWNRVAQDFAEPGLRDIDLIFRVAGDSSTRMPVLLRHYFNMSAKFLAVGIDRNFSDTPGLLLQVDTDQVSGRTAAAILRERGSPDRVA